MINLLDVENLHFSYNKALILKGVDLSVNEGEYVSLVGINGSGKSTFFSLLSEDIAPKSGTIRLNGKDISTMSARQKAQIMAIVTQSQNLNFPFTCLEIVLMGAHPHLGRLSHASSDQLEEAKKIMEQMEIWQFAGRPITDISGGERQKVILARAFMQKPKILLLDEAMSELDISAKYSIMKLIQHRIRKTGMAVLSINHDLSLVYKFSDRVAALKDGKIYASGTPQKVMSEDFFRNVFSVDAEILGDKGFIVNDNI